MSLFEKAQARAAAPAQPPAPAKPLPIRLLLAAALCLLAMVIGAVIWGVVAYFSNTVFVIIAIVAGMAVSAALLFPLAPINKWAALLFLPVALAASLASVVMGESLFVVLILMRDNGSGLMEAAAFTLQNLGEVLSSPDMGMSLVLGGIGALIGFFYAWRELK